MKSKMFNYFNALDDQNKKFREDFANFAKCPNEIKNELLKKYLEYEKTIVHIEKNIIRQNLSEQTKMDLADINSIFNIFGFFLKNINDEDNAGDTAEKWIDDLIELKIVQDAKKAELLAFINTMWIIAKEEFKKIQDEQSWSTGVLPSFKGIGHTIEMRGVFEKKFHLGQKLSEYNPVILDIIPIISIGISNVNELGEEESFGFHATIDQVKLIINELQSSLKEMDAFEKWQKMVK
jgi:hypothetical protein